jgi:UDP-3-O-[3-hydroxymyristoyl] N-acetylglucosamine deacetylase / 3-hydroxyacyl-[acyl-carrier-protein] dehydratase
MTEKQRTIKEDIILNGVGLHTGKEVIITFKPAKENAGVTFKRVDLENKPEIKADVNNVVETSRSTVLQQNGASVATVEHVLSAAYGLKVDNLIIEINGPETPILDGSSKIYADKLTQAGIVEQNAERKSFSVTKKVGFKDEKTGTAIAIYPDDHLRLIVMIDYNSTVIGNQYAMLETLDHYKTEISPCKTFVFFKELEYLLNNNQIKGGDLSNALVIVDKDFTQKEFDRIADLFHKDHRVYQGRGILNENDMTFSNDPARHKILDLLGDLSLLGTSVTGTVIATKPGHFSNIEFVKLLKKELTATSKA